MSPRRYITPLWWFIFVMVHLGVAQDAHAHVFDPVVVDVRTTGDETATVTWRRSLDADAALPAASRDAQPALADGCVHGERRERTIDATVVREVDVTCDPGLTLELELAPLAGGRLDVIVHEIDRDGDLIASVLLAGGGRWPPPPEDVGASVTGSFVWLGLGHIVAGPDHLLFVLCILLLAGDWRRTIGVVTAFTAAHSVTLSASALGMLSVPIEVAEILIAWSVALLAAELLRGDTTTLATRYPASVAFAFGLVHGLGFASALEGLGWRDGIWPLLGFNLGVELGQLAFVAVLIATGALARGLWRDWERHWPTTRAAMLYPTGTLAMFWFFDRGVDLIS